jgi:fatty acid desaturase
MGKLPDPARLPRGYVESTQTADVKTAAEATSLAKSLRALAFDHAVALSCAIGEAALVTARPAAWLTTVLPACLLIGRSQRALEAMTHEASHFNITRSRLNDIIGNVGAALTVFSTVKGYRATHALHHRWFGSDRDPCRRRYTTLRFTSIDRGRGVVRFARDVFDRTPRYWAGWWNMVGSDAPTASLGLLWHAVMWLLVGCVLGTAIAAIAALHWFVSFLIVLPFIRLAGEADEHDYERGSEYAATFSSLGRWQRFWLHPHGDGFHAEHHRYPRIPHHRLAWARRQLLAIDPTWHAAPTRRGIVTTI